MCYRSAAIVDGVLETEASRIMPGNRIETDFWIKTTRVIKGPLNLPKIVVSEMGGTVGELHLIMNFPLLERTQRYILFLYDDKRAGVPPVPGLPRYEADILYGTFKVEASFAH